MARKLAFNVLPVIIAIAVVLLVLYLVSRPDSSPFAKAVQWFSSHIEGFSAPISDTPKCPGGFRFFNDNYGESFCCKGKVNPYTHRCEAKPDSNNLCAFKDGVPDPRKRDGTILPTCSSLTTQTHKANQDAHCPASLPNYGTIGKCCKMGTDLDGYDCSEMDNADMARYCVIGQPTKPGEQACDNLQMSESAFCPAGLQKMNYAMGEREVKKYGNSAQGKIIPVCFGVDNTCIPDTIVSAVQREGIYTDKKVGGWKYACSGYEKTNVKKDLTGSMDLAYI